MLRSLLSARVLLGVLIILILGGAGYAAYYFYDRYNQVVKNPEIITKQEADWLTERVSKLMKVPNDEVPTIATVLDKEKLKDQSFFKNAENGDKVLVYVKEKKAILYRPSANVIIEVGPVNMDAQQQGTSQNIRIALYNGTVTAGLTNTAETKIKEKIVNAEITLKENAKKQDYKKTIVVDLIGGKEEQTKVVADAVGGEVGTLPDGEVKPDADVAIILGQ